MRLTMPMCCATKCCGCIVLSQLTGVVLSIGALGLFLGLFYWYILPWGQSQIVQSLHLPKGTSYDSISDATLNAQKCNGCVLGRNTQWPTTSTGTLHFLDTTAGTLISSTVATSLVAAASVGAGSMLWAALFPTMASILSFSSGFYEMTHIIEMAQYISIIGQLRLKGAPEFLDQFSKTMAWTNFNIPKSITGAILPIGKRRLSSTGFSAVEPKFGGNSGPAKYAKAIGVEPKYLFFYTLGIFGLVLVLFHLLFVIWIFLMAAISKRQSFSEIGATWYRKVVWAIILALLLAQYIFAMTGSYYLYENVRFSETDSNFIIGCIILVALIGCTALFGIIIISRNKQELKDLGTYEHEQRPFASKYSAYYDEYNYDNRYFFVPRILLAISTGIIVGIVQEPTSQILCILSLTMMYLALLILREPNLLRFLYYVGIASVFMKVVLHCLLLLLVHDDVFPQEVRNKASYAIIGINIFIFFLLFIRQAYLIVYKIVQACKHKDEGHEEIEMDARGQRMDRNQIQTPGYDGVSGRYERLGSQGPYDQMTVEQQKLYGKNPSAHEADRLGTMGGQPHRPQVRWSDQSQPVNGPTSPMGGMSGGVMYSRTLRPSRNEGVAETGVVPQEPASNAKPQPTWRRNIERRAQEAAAAAAVDTKPLKSLRESNDTTSSYDLEPGGTTQIPVSTTQRSSTTSSQDWFQQRMSSIESEMTQTFSSSALEFRDSGTSFITDRPGLPVSKNPSITPLPENDSIRSLSQSPHGINRVETSEIDRVADGYLHQKPLRAVERSIQGDVDIDALDSGSERGSSLCRPSSIDIDQNSDEEGSIGTDPDEERETSRLSLLPTRNARGVVNDSFVSAMSYEETR